MSGSKRRLARLRKELKAASATATASAPSTARTRIFDFLNKYRFQFSFKKSVVGKSWYKFSIRKERSIAWLRGRELQHFGPTYRIQELFHRRDHVYLALSTHQLQWRSPPPLLHHDVFDAAAKVSQTEAAIGYTFNNKMLCVEALKMSGSATPLYCNGSVWPVANNNRLALLGDRALGMVICEIWFMTGNSTRDYSVAERNIVSRASLARSGCALGIQDKILFAASLSAATPDMIAETFEAIIGAVYADSDYTLSNVSTVVKHLALDDHRFLKLPWHQASTEGVDPEQEATTTLKPLELVRKVTWNTPWAWGPEASTDETAKEATTKTETTPTTPDENQKSRGAGSKGAPPRGPKS